MIVRYSAPDFVFIFYSLMLSACCTANEPNNQSVKDRHAKNGHGMSRADLISHFQQVKPTYIDIVDERIKSVSLGPNYFTDETIAVLCPTQSLLQVKGCANSGGITRRGFRTLLKCTNLESVKVRLPMKLDPATLELIGELDQLRALVLIGAELDAAGVKFLGTLPNLETLALPETNLNNEMLKELVPLRLSQLDVSGSQVTDSGLLLYQNHPTMKSIQIGEIPVTRSLEESLAPIELQRSSHSVFDVLGELATLNDDGSINDSQSAFEKQSVLRTKSE